MNYKRHGMISLVAMLAVALLLLSGCGKSNSFVCIGCNRPIDGKMYSQTVYDTKLHEGVLCAECAWSEWGAEKDAHKHNGSPAQLKKELRERWEDIDNYHGTAWSTVEITLRGKKILQVTDMYYREGQWHENDFSSDAEAAEEIWDWIPLYLSFNEDTATLYGDSYEATCDYRMEGDELVFTETGFICLDRNMDAEEIRSHIFESGQKGTIRAQIRDGLLIFRQQNPACVTTMHLYGRN